MFYYAKRNQKLERGECLCSKMSSGRANSKEISGVQRKIPNAASARFKRWLPNLSLFSIAEKRKIKARVYNRRYNCMSRKCVKYPNVICENPSHCDTCGIDAKSAELQSQPQNPVSLDLKYLTNQQEDLNQWIP